MSGTAFSTALRDAISASGLGLDRVQARLQEHGISISVTSLSYWQSGKRQPERQSSISAVRVLEEILDIPPGSLLGLLAPPRPRGASSRRRADELVDGGASDEPDDDTGSSDEGSAPHAAPGSVTADGGTGSALTLVALHDRCEVGEDDTLESVAATAVFTAAENGPDRWLLACRRAPRVSAVRNCTLGRVRHHEDRDLTLAELVFDHALAAGESQLVEYALSFDGPAHDSARIREHVREFDAPIHHYLLEVRFGGGRRWRHPRPQRLAASTSDGVTQVETAALRLDPGGVAHALTVDFGPGTFGITWSDGE